MLLAIAGLCAAARRGDTYAPVTGEVQAADGSHHAVGDARLGRRTELEHGPHGARRGSLRGDARLGAAGRAAA
ncbi:MAG TPA: hypothetical protein VII01_09105 [Solirubrobacteraceae bacterium]